MTEPLPLGALLGHNLLRIALPRHVRLACFLWRSPLRLETPEGILAKFLCAETSGRFPRQGLDDSWCVSHVGAC